MKNFIKTFNKELANALAADGFDYITEYINDGQVLYSFEYTPELKIFMDAGVASEQFGDVYVIEDSTVNF